jgi:hypothetical protein
MDDARFDAWTRRRFGLAAGGLAVVLGELVWGDAAAKKKHKHKHKRTKCKSQQTRCHKQCFKGNCCPGKPCGAGGQECVCGRTSAGKTFCYEQILALCQSCNSDADCTAPSRCVQVTGCDEVTAICLPACGTAI